MKRLSKRCRLCQEPLGEVLDNGMVWGFVSRELAAVAMGVELTTVNIHCDVHLKGWMKWAKGERAKLMEVVRQKTAREMAEGVFNLAMEHVEIARASGKAVEDIAHLEVPLGIAMQAAGMVGKITGEVPVESAAGVIGGGGNGNGPISVLVMPRAFAQQGIAQQGIEAKTGPIIDVGPVVDSIEQMMEKEEDSGDTVIEGELV